jgi:diguanylate cyclase (GGDEF)-like protein/PAS domain S-box-containing protein
MPSMAVGGALIALAACTLTFLVLWVRERRRRAAVANLGETLHTIAIDNRFDRRVLDQNGEPTVNAIREAVNEILEKLSDRNEQALERDTLFAHLMESVSEAVVVHREHIEYANSRFGALVGLAPRELIGRKLAELVPNDYAELVSDNIRRRLAGEPASERYEIELVGAQGQVSRLELATAPLNLGGTMALLITAIEMTPRRASPAQVQDRSRALATLDSIGEGVVATDTRGRIDYMNQAAESLTGLSSAAAAGKLFADIASLVDESSRKSLGDPVRQCLATGARVTLGRRALLLSKEGAKECSIELSAAPIRATNQEIAGAVIILHDVTEMSGLARQMSYQASHDALTGLVNRREFERRLQEALEVAHGGQTAHVLCFLDLDNFKVVNDTCGHLAGDNMLREIATLLKDQVRDSDTVARLGGDEFGLLLVGCPLEKARQIADDVTHAVNDYRFVWKDKIFNVGVSVGLVEIGQESGSLDDVMSAADSACYIAKKQGPIHVHIYSVRDEASARHRGEIQWLQKLQAALRDNRFELYVQPIVATTDGGDSNGPALEVFVRMMDGEEASVSPSQFIRTAERYRLMPLVDRWVVQTALAAIGQGGLKVPEGRSVAINIAGQTLGDSQFLEFVVDCFDRTGVAPSQLCFEVTENSVISNLDYARRFIGVLHGMGCKFALDDFGSGLGSFSNLKTLAMDYLKIDGSFMRNIARDTVNQAMVTAMIKLARTLNFKTIAEQVEDQSSLDAARKMGIDFVQGYITGRPQPMQAVN